MQPGLSPLKIIALLSLLLGSSSAAAQSERVESRTLQLAFHSEILEEEREILVRLPPDYLSNPEFRYPVFYVTDADWNFDLVASTLDFHARWGRIPPFIIVGLLNVNRNRDFVPQEDSRYPFTGGGDRFLNHLNEELLPLVDSNYRSSEHRVLFGHSFGGVAVLNQLLREPKAFDAYLAIGTSTWVSDRVMFDRLRSRLDGQAEMSAFLFLSVGEGDGGATVPDGERLAALLNDLAPESLTWTHSVLPGENHFTNVPISLHEALRRLFPFFDQASEMTARVEQDGAAGVARWFEEQQADLGWRFVPQSMELGLAAAQLATSDREDPADAVFDHIEARYPDRPETIAYRAMALARTDRPAAAIEVIERAIAVGQRVGHPESRMVSFRRFRDNLQGQL